MAILKFILLRTFIIGFVLFLGSVAYLDIQVRQKFEGQKWALPAHVYTRPYEIYIGQSLDQAGLIEELTELGYQKRNKIDRVGSYTLDNDFIEIHQRPFVFWDGEQKQQIISISLNQGKVSDLVLDGDHTELVSLEPRLFGSVSPLSHEDRALLKLDEVPPQLIQALIAIEDRQFYSHFGINPLGIARAMIRNVTAGKVVQGGSTLTQQLVKNYYLTSDRTIKRKITEMIMAVLLEVHYSKDEILQTYLNEVYLSQSGNRAIHGFALGSLHFFGRPLQELELHELAMLAGIMKGPGYYNPLRHPKRAVKRRNIVLKAMLEQQNITDSEYQHAISASLKLAHADAKRKVLNYSSFQELVRKSLLSEYQSQDLGNDGLQIHTTLNPRIQQTLEQAIDSQLQSVEKQRQMPENSLQVAALVVRTDNGEVAALVGDRHNRVSGFNRALNAKRPMGSLIKPFVYLTALERAQDYSLASALQDTAVVVSQSGSPDWLPKNYDGKEHGEVMLVDALARSYNLSTIRLGMTLGVDSVVDTIERVSGVQSIKPLPSILLGAVEMSPIDVTQMYLSLASGGFKMPIKTVRSVLSKGGQPLSRYPLAIDQVVEPEPATLINYALQEVVRNGTARSVLSQFNYDYGLAGKTGTTDDYRDSWFAGFSGNYLMVVWVGHDDNTSTGLTGASGAARVWASTMSALPLTRMNLAYTEEMVTRSVRHTNQEADDTCQQTRELPFMKKSLPLVMPVCAQYNNDLQVDQTGSALRSLFERLF